jgi:aspartate aminotransferase
VLPASAFGEKPEALRVRVATAMLYGENDEQRERALMSDDPARLPWIAAALDRIDDVLTDVASKRPDMASRAG